LILFGGCNCGKGKHLRFCRASNSQRRGRGFESHLLHQAYQSQLFSSIVLPSSPLRTRQPHDSQL